jgi:hypothetical protein
MDGSDEAGSDDGDAGGGMVREDKEGGDETKHDMFPVCNLSYGCANVPIQRFHLASACF